MDTEKLKLAKALIEDLPEKEAELFRDILGYIERSEAERDELRAQLETVREALGLILPLAKGYAAAHPKVESNRRYCQIADSILQPDSGKDGG